MTVIAIVVILIFMMIIAIITLGRLRKGGPGPQVNWVPRSMRASVNRRFEKRGWQKPYDENGNRNPDRGQL